MPIIVNKILKGAVIQDVSAPHNYLLPEVGINSSQNAISSANFEEVFIDCFTNVGVQSINLPAISLFRRGFSPKIYVTNKGSNEVTINPYISEEETNSINTLSSWVIAPNTSGYLHIVNNTNWALWQTPLAI